MVRMGGPDAGHVVTEPHLDNGDAEFDRYVADDQRIVYRKVNVSDLFAEQRKYEQEVQQVETSPMVPAHVYPTSTYVAPPPPPPGFYGYCLPVYYPVPLPNDLVDSLADTNSDWLRAHLLEELRMRHETSGWLLDVLGASLGFLISDRIAGPLVVELFRTSSPQEQVIFLDNISMSLPVLMWESSHIKTLLCDMKTEYVFKHFLLCLEDNVAVFEFLSSNIARDVLDRDIAFFSGYLKKSGMVLSFICSGKCLWVLERADKGLVDVLCECLEVCMKMISCHTIGVTVLCRLLTDHPECTQRLFKRIMELDIPALSRHQPGNQVLHVLLDNPNTHDQLADALFKQTSLTVVNSLSLDPVSRLVLEHAMKTETRPNHPDQTRIFMKINKI